MTRFRLAELSIGRIYAALTRRLRDIPNGISWSLSAPRLRSMVQRMDSLVDRHRGERCFIIGNGPSLAAMNLSMLKHENTFGLNRIYLLFDRLEFLPTYYVCVNELVLEQFAGEISHLPMSKFLNWNRRALFDIKSPDVAFLRLSLNLSDRFNSKPRRPFYSGGTVTYVALQLAFIMGFSEVILVGVDHSFSDKGIPNKVETRRAESDPNHFHPDYFPKGSKWQLPDLRRSEAAYSLAQDTFQKDGRRILDATVGGRCPVFEKIDFRSLF